MRYVIFCQLLFPLLLLSQVTDYSVSEHWAALPERKDAADWTPRGLEDQQASALADVFFIHPTTKLTGWGSNASVNSKAVNKMTDERAIRNQATVFNGSCRVYAPRYQQASLHTFFKREGPSSKAAFDLAYQDIRAAFEYYMKHYNQGRPVVIAGHSQGSMHAARLLKEYFDGKPLQEQLVAAFLIGWPVKRSEFKQIPISDSARHLGAIISYNTFGWEAEPGYIDYKGSVCVNPLSWKTGNEFVSAKSHKGGISQKFEGVKPNLAGCKCANGMLQIQKPAAKGYTPMTGKNYHLHDYQLFFQDIRENVAERVGAYLSQRER
jgi:pimeloyl-ACP methyl ester carboxylesterase